MRLPDKYIRGLVISALGNNFCYPIRDTVAWKSDSEPYVLLSIQNNFDDSTKTCFGLVHSLMIQVYGRQSNTVSRAEIEDIGNDIMEAVIKLKTGDYESLSTSDFQLLDISLDSTTDDMVFNGDNISARKNIIINFTLRELANN